VSYLLDANVFIEAKNRHYGFDLCPGFWTWLDEAHERGLVHSVEKVREELLDGGDELADWAKERGAMFLPPDDGVVESLRNLAIWASGAGYEDAAVSTFLQAGDSYLVAHAGAHGLNVVTHEVAADTRKKIKIPNACDAMDVKHCTLYAMLKNEGARFVLEEPN
jgi:hypothetical protein